MPATTGTRPAVTSTAAVTTCRYSSSSSEKNSPVPQAGKTAPGAVATCASRCARKPSGSREPSARKLVSGNDRTPFAMPSRSRRTVSEKGFAAGPAAEPVAGSVSMATRIIFLWRRHSCMEMEIR